MQYDLIIIGSGPAGYVAAIRAGQTGLKTLVIDKKYVGGMCLNWGCIPSKSLLESAKLYHRVLNAADFGVSGIDQDALSLDWGKAVERTKSVVKRLSRGIEFLWKKNGVEFLKAEAKIVSATEVEAGSQIFETKNIMISTGSRPAQPDLKVGFLDLESFLELEKLPLQPVLYGSGSVVYEMAQLFHLLGAKPTIVATEEVLMPSLDKALDSWIMKKLKKDKIAVLNAGEVSAKKGKLFHKDIELDHDMVINCSLRKAVLPESKLTIELDRGFIMTDEYFQSSIKGIYAAGDVNGKSFLAHSASAQGLAVINHIHGKAEALNLNLNPINIYSSPEIAQIGMTEAMLKEKGIDYGVGEFSLAANGKALTEGNSEGFLRLLYEKKYSQVLGVQIVAESATDMIAEAAVLMQMEGTVYELASAIHAHPTVSEVFMELGQQLTLEK